MRVTPIAAALALALAAGPAAASELDELKAQIAALQERIAELEQRTDAQSEINVQTQQNLDQMQTNAPKVETKGGIKVTSADKKFEAQIGGRIHFDAYAFDRDLANTTGTTDFRRAPPDPVPARITDCP